ncbi:MAG: metal-sensing transcriptional repressor [Clostridium sp.]|nr:metal-sensing transcriptional repressor [Clostridium sp.]MCM1548264.1 metal-sensing transcriptional repressor [Ruminococcus sp.]
MGNNEKECCRRYKHTPRSEEKLRQLHSRINRIVGQLGGIQKMLDENRYCGDILTQIAAVESALQSVGYIVLEEHLKTCAVEEIQNGNSDIMSEALELMKKLK